jgi:ADP-dependent NAD(P)H-hydrate dehydratase / NAD(P)H-hydrate epimerase
MEAKKSKRDYYFLKPQIWEDATKFFFRKKDHFHKYNSGSAIFIGGEKGMEGALYLSIQAFLGCGGGIAKSFFLSPDAKSIFLESNPSLMIDHWYEDSKSDPFWKKAKTVVMGPGTDAGKNYKSIIEYLVSWAREDSSRRIILDAGAIQPVAEFSDQWILTPHFGEYTRLAPKKQEINSGSILENGKLSAQVLGCNLLIKSSKQYFNDNHGNSWLWDYPNSKLATMGTGDLLTGIIALALNRDSKPKVAIYKALCFLDLSRNMNLTSPTASEILEYLKVQ